MAESYRSPKTHHHPVTSMISSPWIALSGFSFLFPFLLAIPKQKSPREDGQHGKKLASSHGLEISKVLDGWADGWLLHD